MIPQQQGLPGQPQQPPMPAGGTGAAQQMRPMPGQGAQALSLLHAGVEALQKALVGLPMGSELHSAVLKAVTDISRRMTGGNEDHAAQIQALSALAREAQQNPQQAMLQKMFQQPGAPGGGAQPQQPMQ